MTRIVTNHKFTIVGKLGAIHSVCVEDHMTEEVLVDVRIELDCLENVRQNNLAIV